MNYNVHIDNKKQTKGGGIMLNAKEMDTLKEKREDADELIREVLKRIPEESKGKVLDIIQGFALCAESNRKAG
jgi:hypothetical protein